MRKILKSQLMIGILVLALACSGESLELKPLDAIAKEDVYNDINLLTAYVNAGYSYLPLFSNGQRMGTDPLADHAYAKPRLGEGVPQYSRNTLDALNVETVTKNTWRDSYRALRHINSYFEGIKESSIPKAQLESLTGQMHFLRAFYHFNMMRYYGGIPIITKRFGIDEEKEKIEPPRNTLEEVIDFIIKELDTAAPLLKADAPRARASKAAAMALKGRVLLYAASPLLNATNDQAKWEKAAVANKAVMDLAGYPLADNYRSIFLSRPSISDEIIFTREFNLEVHQGAWAGANTMYWPNGYGGWHSVSPNQEFVDLFEMKNGETPYLTDGPNDGKKAVNPKSGYDPQDPYKDRDPRLKDIVLYNGVEFRGRKVEYFVVYEDDGNGAPGETRKEVKDKSGKDTHLGTRNGHEPSGTGYAYRKLTDPTTDVVNSGRPSEEFTPDIQFRKTEFYLNYAETQIALGNEAAAREAINKVRARQSVGMPPIPATVSGAELVRAYRRERAIELSLEGHRFFDIRRWKIGNEVMGKPMYGIHIEKLSTGKLVYSYGTKVAEQTNLREWNDRLYWLPIPDAQIKASNNKMKQNPGYE